MKLPETQTHFLNSIQNSDQDLSFIDQPERMEIYYQNWSGAIRSTMLVLYPVIEKLVGEDFFTGTVKYYRESHLPASTNLDEYGESFSTFLETFEPAQQLPYLPEVARLEWTIHEAIHAPSSKTLAFEELATIPPEQYTEMYLRAKPSLILLKSTYPIDKIWRMNQTEGFDESINLDEAARSYIVVRRDGYDIKVESVYESEYAFLEQLCNQKSLLAAYEEACKADPDFDFAYYLRKTVSSNYYSGYSILNR